MNSETNKAEQSYSDQLSDFEGQLKQTMNDASLLQDVDRTIRELLKEHRDSEEDMRLILLTRLESGSLRKESFDLVGEMLDRILSDDREAQSAVAGRDQSDRRDFRETDVITTQSLDADNPQERLQAGSVLRDRFLLQERVAGGSTGVVYKALDRRLAEADEGEPWVAIKVLSPAFSRNGSALRALQQEAAKGRCLSHPNIVRFLDLDCDDELYFIVMEWLEGRSLATILDDARSHKIDVTTALDIVGQLGRALDYAHRCGVVHADVKPSNVMIVPSGQVKLFDFGVARIRQQQCDTVARFDPAVPGEVTPAYSSMQVLTGDEPVPTDDVFSLACLLYRLVAGYRVFGPRNAAEAVEEGMEPQRPKGLSDSQWKALKKALAHSRVARYSSPLAFIHDLKQVDDDLPVATGLDEPVFEEADEGHGGRWFRVAAAAALFGLLAYAVTETQLLEDVLTRGDSKPMPAMEVDTDRSSARELRNATRVADAPDVAIQAGNAALAQAEREGIEPQSAEFPATAGTAAPDEADENRLIAPAEPMVPATHRLVLKRSAAMADELDVTLREEQGPAVIDLHRTGEVDAPLALRLDEVGFSGNRSPGRAGQYRIANNGIVKFAARQEIARTTIRLESNNRSEPDRQVRLLVRELDNPVSELAVINLTLEDDERRNVEAGLVPNTVAFWLDRTSVRESDPAVQIDVLRLNPDAHAFEVDYIVRDISATEGEDYFAPGITTISFAANQRTVRLLIPLVQDAIDELDETFMLEIVSPAAGSEANINRHITVMIRDDDFTVP